MTDKTASQAPDFLTPEEQALEADAREWREVSEEDVAEVKFTFDAVGDQFIGVYTGLRVIENENGKFTQFRFTRDGEHYFINAGWNLIQGMRQVREGQRVRITWISERDTGAATPMRVFRVDVARSNVTATAPRQRNT